MKIVIDDKIPFIKGVLEPYSEVIYLPGADFRGKIKDADALIIRTRTKCNESLLKDTSVKFIASATIGFDHIDTSWCDANGIKWTNAPGCNSGSVYQYIASALLSLATRHNSAFKDMTLGVVGVGNVGSKIVRLGRILGMNVLMNDPPRAENEKSRDFVSFDRIMEQCDIISIHVPLNMSGRYRTFHLLDHDIFGHLIRKPYIINSSRGEVVDSNALKYALSTKKIKGAVLDVWENEPEIDVELMKLVDLATPHIAGYSADGKAKGTAMSVAALSRFFKLPLTGWSPSNIPLPSQPLHFHINCADKSFQECICQAVLYSYNIAGDDMQLRKSPGTFEKQRGAYPVRREFEAYSISLENDHSGVGKHLGMLGYTLINKE